MKPLSLVNLALTGAIAISAISFAAPANAACTNSEWSMSSGNAFANTIFGRLCGPNMAVRFAGAVNTGWIAMQGGNNQFSATYVDANVSTEIIMQTTGTTMHVNFIHTDNNGAKSLTQGNYNLVSLQ